jgi:hypothetical protein
MRLMSRVGAGDKIDGEAARYALDRLKACPTKIAVLGSFVF